MRLPRATRPHWGRRRCRGGLRLVVLCSALLLLGLRLLRLLLLLLLLLPVLRARIAVVGGVEPLRLPSK